MDALTIPHNQDIDTAQSANVTNGLHAVAGAIDRIAGIGPIGMGLDDVT